MSDYKYIIYEEEDAVAYITLNREDVYNALNKEAKLEIVKAVRAANKNVHIGSILITANGKAFCTGQDLNDRTVQSNQGQKVDLGKTLETEWNPLVNAIRNSKKVVVTAINGVCAGAGLSVAFASDLITAKPEIKFISGFSKLGLAPDAGASFKFLRGLGYQKTMEFFLFNEAMTSDQLDGYSMINYTGDDYLEKAKEFAIKASKLSFKSSALIKKNLQVAATESFESSLQNELYAQRFLGNSPEYQEGLNAFFEKRNPKFQ